MKKFYLSLIALAACVCSLTAAEHRADYNVIPLPKEVTVDDAHVFTLQPGMGIAYDANNEEVCRNARFLRDWVEEMTGIELLLTPGDYKAAVKLTLGISTNKGESTGELTPQQEEAYVIIVDKKGVTIQAHNPVGFFRAAQTLRKSLPVVKDEPRFEYRGVLLDCGRHFFSKENQLQSYINREIEEFIKGHGRDIIGWDEILEGGLSGSSIVMSWRGVKGGIAAASKIYSFEPLIPEELTPEQQRLILGPQINLWTKHVKYPAHAFYQLLPRLGASSEVQWCLPEQKDFEDFKERLPHLKEIYEVLGVPYCKLLE